MSDGDETRSGGGHFDGIDTGSAATGAEHGFDDDEGEATDDGSDETVDHALSLSHHEHDGGEEEAAEGEDEADHVQNAEGAAHLRTEIGGSQHGPGGDEEVESESGYAGGFRCECVGKGR